MTIVGAELLDGSAAGLEELEELLKGFVRSIEVGPELMCIRRGALGEESCGFVVPNAQMIFCWVSLFACENREDQDAHADRRKGGSALGWCKPFWGSNQIGRSGILVEWLRAGGWSRRWACSRQSRHAS